MSECQISSSHMYPRTKHYNCSRTLHILYVTQIYELEQLHPTMTQSPIQICIGLYYILDYIKRTGTFASFR